MPRRLNCVGVEKHAFFMTYLAYFANGLNSAYFVVCKHYGNKRRIFPYCVFKFINTHKAVRMNG